MSQPSSSPLHVLVADDAPVNLRLASALLRRMGHTGVLVPDGEQALLALEQHRFDVVLMDVSMPMLDGLSALKEIREAEHRGRARIPVIMVTGHDSPDDIARFMQAGADGFIAKPIQIDGLQRELQRVLQR